LKKIYVLNLSRCGYAENPIWEHDKLKNLIKEVISPTKWKSPELLVICDSLYSSCIILLQLSKEYDDVKANKNAPDGWCWPTHQHPEKLPKLAATIIKKMEEDGTQILLIVCEDNSYLPKNLPKAIAEEMGITADIVLDGSHTSKMLEIDIQTNQDDGTKKVTNRYIYDDSSSY